MECNKLIGAEENPIISQHIDQDLMDKYSELERIANQCTGFLLRLSTKILDLTGFFQDKPNLVAILTAFYKQIKPSIQIFEKLCMELHSCIIHNNSSICYPATKLAISSISLIVCDCIQSAETLRKNFRQRHVDALISQMMILDATEQFIENAKNSDPHCIFYLPKDHEDWKLLNRVVTYDVSV
jgi:hypothetical protein